METFYHLLCQGFLGICWDDFVRDFQEKDAVIILCKDHSEGEIVGFSTLMVLTLTLPTEEIKGIFSGDTVVLPEYRSSTGLGVGLCQYFVDTYEQFPQHKVYYILISKGWRTYKIMPFFFQEFAPHHQKSTSACEKAVIDAFGKTKYPHYYHPETGLILFGKHAARLKPESIDAVPLKMDAHTQFFLQRNPGYLRGNELVCVARVAPDNATAIFQRLVPFHATF
jgi:hypothetical protein